jgi:hypothetical protein
MSTTPDSAEQGGCTCGDKSRAPDAGLEDGAGTTQAAADLEVFRIATEHFRHDIEAHWTQASFFALIQAALISVFASIVGPREQGTVSVLSAESEAAVIAIGGLAFAILWSAMAFGRERYIRMWRDAVVRLDKVVDRHCIYVPIEERAAGDFLNPTRLTTIIPLVMVLGWVFAVTWALGWA